MVKIMIDSASDISKKEGEQLGIIVVPIEVMFGEESFLDGESLMPEGFYNKLKSEKTLPKTSLINEFRWEEEFKNATADGSDLVVIALSSKLSGTYNSAKEASKKFENVHVVDSLNAATGERLLGLYALKLKSKNLPAKEIADRLNEVKTKINVVAMVDTLKYLRLGGRISGATAVVGEMLNIKPIIAVISGEVKNIGKAIGVKKGALMLKNIVKDKGGVDLDMPYGIVYSGNDHTNLNRFLEDSKDIFEGNEAGKYILGSTIGTHIGPGAIGVAFFEK